MKTYIVILRGINVSGKNKLPMAALRVLLEDLQYQNIQTYIQSGNIVFTSTEDRTTITNKIKEAIKQQFGYDVPVLIKTAEEWKTAINANPYTNKEDDKKKYFTFLDAIPKETIMAVNQATDDEYTILKDVVYVYCEGGYGKTKLNNNFFERKLKVTATTRNYKTTMKLLEIAKKHIICSDLTGF